jgi:hypothetical protein
MGNYFAKASDRDCDDNPSLKRSRSSSSEIASVVPSSEHGAEEVGASNIQKRGSGVVFTSAPSQTYESEIIVPSDGNVVTENTNTCASDEDRELNDIDPSEITPSRPRYNLRSSKLHPGSMGEPVDYTLRVSSYDIAGKFRDHIAVSEDKQLVGIFDSVRGGAGEFYEQHIEECFGRCFNLVVEYTAEYEDEVLSDVDIIKKTFSCVRDRLKRDADHDDDACYIKDGSDFCAVYINRTPGMSTPDPFHYVCCDVGCSRAMLCRDGKALLLSNPLRPTREILSCEGNYA